MNYGESSIAVTTHPIFGEHELWVMKEYGVVESWTELLAFRIQMRGSPFVSGFRKNGEVLLVVDDGELTSLDLNSQQMKPHGVETRTGLLSVEGNYVESLVLLDKGVDVPRMSFANLAIN
ncbi:hypothetical protein V6N12_024817 [Hibiscus sabdariffa]|uniref:F-box associated domain-containing protein n=1 Tax=Hibiscus sabdariffa TaxID=183260 RepID=A0ABR2B9H5_9ROSI